MQIFFLVEPNLMKINRVCGFKKFYNELWKLKIKFKKKPEILRHSNTEVTTLVCKDYLQNNLNFKVFDFG